MENTFKSNLYKLFKKDARLWNDETKELNETLLKDLIDKLDEKLIELLLSNKETQEKFFIKVKDVFVFKQNELKFFIDENKLDNSYTQYQNKIGLRAGNRLLSERNEVVLDWPFKDCVLEGGMTKEDQKRNEIFFNEILAKDEIDRLLDPKALVNWKRYTARGGEKLKELKRDKDGIIRENLIIKGNNLLALHSLKEQFTGKVKLIYIDPPYNTVNDGFKYNNNFNHSTWLTFMKNRLEMARGLLRDDGVMFVQCDDNEQAYLKVLMDEIFGRDNFVSNFIWEKTQHFGRQKINYYSNAENILCFAKQLFYDTNKKQLLIEKYISDFDDAPLYNASNPKKILTIPKGKCQFRIDDGEYDKSTDKKYVLLDRVKVKNSTNENTFRVEFRSRWTNETLNREIEKGDMVLIKSNKFSPRIIYNLDKSSFVSPKQIIFTNEKNPLCNQVLGFRVGTTSSGSSENISLFNKKTFDYPKPESLIGYIIEISTQHNDIVLDYHIGSGTTAAVAHKMGRQYIGIEQMDYTKPIAVSRMKKVVTGEQGGISKFVNWQGGGDFIYFELAKWNETAKEKILKAKSLKELEKLFDELYERYFLNYNIKTKAFKEKIIKEEEFKRLSLDEQKKLFVQMLDMNQMYVNFSERADKKYNLSKDDIALSEEFYDTKK